MSVLSFFLYFWVLGGFLSAILLSLFDSYLQIGWSPNGILKLSPKEFFYISITGIIFSPIIWVLAFCFGFKALMKISNILNTSFYKSIRNWWNSPIQK